MASRSFLAGSVFYVGLFTVAAKHDVTRCFNGWKVVCEQALAWYPMPWSGVDTSRASPGGLFAGRGKRSLTWANASGRRGCE